MAINVNTKYANYIHNCNAHKCKRNKQNIPKEEYMIRNIWQGNFEECEHWKE